MIVFYVFIALLDSLHYQEPLPVSEGQTQVQYSQNVQSVLDAILVGLHQNNEKPTARPLFCILLPKKTAKMKTVSCIGITHV